MRRSYRQYCALARALDVVGERWTLILVRELLLGPKRFGDLLKAAPGMGTNQLADRLHQMEAAGLVEKAQLPPPAGSAVYRLTESGARLKSVVMALGTWGASLMGERRADEQLAPGAYFIAMPTRLDAEAASGLDEAYEFRIDGRVFQVRVRNGTCSTAEGGSADSVASFTMGCQTLSDLFFGLLTPDSALASGAVRIEGRRDAWGRWVELFPLPDLATSDLVHPEAVC